MRKIILALVIVSAVIFVISAAKAAPAPWGIALNLETKECAGFWPGDEFVAYHLPDGWKSYFPKYDPDTQKTTLATEIGECDFKIREEEKCCQQMGYAYTSDNIGKGNKTILRDREEFEKQLEKSRNRKKSPFAAVAILLLAVAAIILLAKLALGRRKKSGEIEK